MFGLKDIESELGGLSPEERLRLVRWLVDSVLKETSQVTADPARSLLAWAGRFSGGPGDTATRAEEILQEELGFTDFDESQ